MRFETYLTYEEYSGLGGKLQEDVFPNAERRARRLLDNVTMNRIQYLTLIPEVVKEVMVEFIDKMSSIESQSGVSSTVAAQYSNGIESFTFRDNAEDKLKRDLYNLAIDWLPAYLTVRSVNFDVEEYLQSESNNPQ